MITMVENSAGRAVRLTSLTLGTAVAYGCFAQGGFYRDGASTVLLLVALAAGTRALVSHRADRFVLAFVVAVLALAGWMLISAGINGGTAVTSAAACCGVAAAAWAASGLRGPSTRVLHAVLLGVGGVLALSGWLGVVFHIEPLALVSSGLWRASSTLTYANATASFLVVTVLLAVAVLPAGRPVTGRLTVAVLLLGLLATMSRAGLLSLAVGLVVCAVPLRAALLRLWPALPAALVAAAGLLPALPDGSAAAPVPAIAGLVLGAAVLWAAGRNILLPLLGLLAVVGLLSGSADAAIGGITSTRLTTTSDERDDLTRITAEQFLTSPVVGVGPGNIDFVYVDHRGSLVSAEYTHQEYLQTAAETGVVGLGLTLLAIGAVAAGAVRRRSPAALAIVAAFSVHSAFDFLWHIPVLPLLVVLTVVPLLTIRTPTAGCSSAADRSPMETEVTS